MTIARRAQNTLVSMSSSVIVAMLYVQAAATRKAQTR